MHTELKDAWQDALRSGLFEQGEGYLNERGTYCCLGVLCEVAIEQGYPVIRVDADKQYYTGRYVPDEGTSRFAYKVADDLYANAETLTDGLLELFGVDGQQQEKFIDFNDNKAYGFNKIADEIDSVVDEDVLV